MGYLKCVELIGSTKNCSGSKKKNRKRANNYFACTYQNVSKIRFVLDGSSLT